MYPKKPTTRIAPWHVIGIAFIITIIIVAVKFFSTDPAGIELLKSF